jgi:hypothetical protein
MTYAVLLLTGLLFSADVGAATGGKGNGAPSPAAMTQSSGRAGGGGAGGGRRYDDPRKAPPLDESRKVSEQDCSKPVDLQAGNLRCK